MTKDQEILMLKTDNDDLRNENDRLRNEVDRLRKRLEQARGKQAQEYVAELTGGKRNTRYKDGHDVTTQNGTLLEVKWSKLQPTTTKTMRWI
jgi:regulator of replication initiation timing